MSYELFRAELYSNLNEQFSSDKTEEIIKIVDATAYNYDFSRKTIELSVVNGIPDILKMYIASKATSNLSKGTLKNYFLVLKNLFFFVNKPYDQIETNDIRLYLIAYKNRRKVCDRTIDTIRVYISSFYDWCIAEELMTKNPASKEKIPPIHYHKRERYVISRMELEMMRFNCVTLREKAILDTLYASGLRVSELCELMKEDISWSIRALHVRHGKGDKERTTYINAEAVISLQAYLNSRTDDCPYVFVNLYGEKHHLEKRAVEVEIQHIAERAGLSSKNINPHNLRHTIATHLINAGCPVEFVQRILGHTKLSTTMIYARISDEDVRRNYERYAV